MVSFRSSLVGRVAGALLVGAIAVVAPPSIALVPATVSAAALPTEARTTLSRIRTGGPFPYPRDGVVFNNRERLLPAMPHGHYREYTVPTPEARNRGARRIVCGAPVATLSECYYSDDHYRSFRKIQP